MADNHDPSLEIAKALLPKEVVAHIGKKAYDEGAAKSVKNVGDMLSDVTATARLLLSPIKALGNLGRRAEQWCVYLTNKIPEPRRTRALPEIAGPVIERLKYTPDESPLKPCISNF